MEKSNTVFRKKKQRRRGRRNAPLYPLLPKSMRVRLKGRTYDTGTAVSSPIFNRYGLVEFLQRGGSFSDSLFGLYSNAIVHGCKINLRLINTSSEPIILAVAHCRTIGFLVALHCRRFSMILELFVPLVVLTLEWIEYRSYFSQRQGAVS